MGLSSAISFMSRDARRAMFPSLRQENFYSRLSNVELQELTLSVSGESLQNK